MTSILPRTTPTPRTSAHAGELPAALSHYDTELRRVLHETGAVAPSDPTSFAPRWELPRPGPSLDAFFAPSTISAHALTEHRGRRLDLLHLMHNPRTRTTKTYASLVIVARAVAHIERTGERVVLLTPSSANKATALRDAVLRAHECGLAGPDTLGIVCVVPSTSRGKLWRSKLSDDSELRRANPLTALDTDEPGKVKQLARAVTEDLAAVLHRERGVRLWHSLELLNYAVADTVRALFERDRLTAAPRLHAHAVSSAFGLLGHFHGQQHITGQSWPDTSAGYFLVQHLGTSDMVSSLYHDRFDYRPRWTESEGRLVQYHDPRFPRTAYTPDEQLDATFYTRRPATSPRMNEIIRRQGGGGIVVSLAECLDRYPALRSLLSPAGVRLPADPRELREWSLVMALTGVFNAIDRDLVDDTDILVHGSGSYAADDYRPVPQDHLRPVTDAADLAAAVREAAN
ncbi:DUF6002 family protein [Streptomyces sp. NPDC096094]|uniref:DUF6002 family protein n=1 Tax=unclassified Streptomyces TaxID=2593676 RepID=UPI00381AE9E1